MGRLGVLRNPGQVSSNPPAGYNAMAPMPPSTPAQAAQAALHRAGLDQVALKGNKVGKIPVDAGRRTNPFLRPLPRNFRGVRAM
jgi:hypothetical protein